MNKMLVAMFDNETAADAGLHALRQLHADGDISLYAFGVLAKDAQGQVSVKHAAGEGPVGTGFGLAVGALMGLLGGPVGLVVGATAGGLLGALRDVWVSGVGLDFVEEAQNLLLPGKVALIAEIEEEWIIPVDVALEAVGGQVFRHSRSELLEAQLNHDVAAFKGEIKDLEDEASSATGSARTRLETKLAAAQVRLEDAVARAKQRAQALEQDAAAKVASLKVQLSQVSEQAKARLEVRIDSVKRSYHRRGAKLAQAWELTREALTG
jgi:uncharacterized membrane protein